MKRLVAGFFAVSLLFSLAPIAEARSSVCITWYDDSTGEACREECSYFDRYGNRTGHVIVDYNC